MKVSELIAWLQGFEDQDATVEVLHCREGRGYYMQGGETEVVEFVPELHAEYTDLRNNPYAKGKPWGDKHALLLGTKDA